MAFKSGKGGGFVVEGTTWPIKRWEVTYNNQLQDVTNTESGGYGQYVAGVSDAKLRIFADHDVGTSPFLTFIEGAQLDEVQLAVEGSTGWFFYGVRIEGVTETLDVRGLVSFTIDAVGSLTDDAFVDPPEA